MTTSHGLALAEIMAIYAGSDGDATRALYDALGLCGPAGTVATNLFRACKASERAKVYRGGQRGRGSFRAMAYERKGWAIDNLAAALSAHAAALDIVWGWGMDGQVIGYSHVLYVDTPAGQISFHSPYKGKGPDYPGVWDGARGMAPQRVCSFAARVLTGEGSAA